MNQDMNSVVKWGILSTANIGKKVGNAIHHSHNAELIAIASRSEERATSWAREHNIPVAYGNYISLISDPTIDAIYIPLPPSMHAEWTIKAANQGKHVLCEKPLSANVTEAKEMATACYQNGVQLMDGVMWVHHDRTPEMKKHIGNLGKLRKVTAAFTFNWDKVPYNNIRAKPELAGGSLGDLGYYCVRAILWAFEETPTQVYATARYTNDVDFNLSAILWFRDDRIATMDCGFDTALRKWFEIAGTKASLVCDDFTVPTNEESSRFWIHGNTNEKYEIGKSIQEINMIEHFSNIVINGTLESYWTKIAVETMSVCDALRKSAQTDKIVKL
ncbi:Gfo/Idh/MocA family oxidoreductase [Candidatus Poribacteria bacterium]|nr:Gfo/Idh/MocA family oxidoreductase [Candidatus Poribacteria bacterium]